MNTPKTFTDALSRIRLEAVFNPYRERCALHDRHDAAQRRRRNLRLCLEGALDAKVDTLWIARDLGYRGGRRTGLALTDDVHLASAARHYGVGALERPTEGPLVAERTAAVVWRELSALAEPVVLWNVFPLHPHEAEDPLSNRCHSRIERTATAPILAALLQMLKPRRIVAIGRDAAAALEGASTPVLTVRHPSYGGQSEFIAGIAAIYGRAGGAAASKAPSHAARSVLRAPPGRSISACVETTVSSPTSTPPSRAT